MLRTWIRPSKGAKSTLSCLIFLTAMDSEADETRGLEFGAVDYITKPFIPAIVNARIKTHLSLQHSIQETRKQKRTVTG